MMKKFAAALAATAVLGVTSVFAANPFSDVTPNDWAYQAVAQLASQGVINGYPDGTFKGQNNITRYEMAQMVAKAMARQDRVDAEQNAMINRLANEFSAELNNLGVRVGKLEDQVGNFKFTGDARMRYRQWDGQHSKFDYRGRVQFAATVNDNTKAVVRVTNGSHEFGDNAYNSSNTAKIDRVYVTHNFGKNAALSVGRQNLTIGGGLSYDSDFDGAAATFGTDKLNASVAYGYLVGGDLEGSEHDSDTHNDAMVVYGLNGKVGSHVTANAFYAQLTGNDKTVSIRNLDGSRTTVNRDSFYGVALNGDFNKVSIGGEWNRSQLDDSTAWIAGIGYGNFNMAQQGTWVVKGQYFDAQKNAQIFDSTYVLPKNRNIKTWIATAKYVPAKNVALAAYVGFDAKDQNDKKINDGTWYRGEINYKF